MPADVPAQPAPEGRVRVLGPSVQVRTGVRRGVLAVKVLGEVDLANHEQLQQALGSLDVSRTARVDLDLSRLSFADARGGCYLLDFVDRARGAGGDVRVLGAQPTLARLLDLLTHLPDIA